MKEKNPKAHDILAAIYDKMYPTEEEDHHHHHGNDSDNEEEDVSEQLS